MRGLAQRCVDDLGTHAYDYDDLYRITDVTYPGPDDVTYTYDAVGNRLTQNSTSYTYDDANQLTSAGGVSFDYDENGNQTDRGSDSFDWDHENRLTEAVIDSTTWSHEYNGDGLRMSRSDGTTTVDYVWDAAAGLPMLLQDGSNTYVYGLGLVSVYDGSDMTYRLTDGLGSTVNLAGEDGEPIGSYEYDVFGNVRAQDGAETEFSFAGEQSDPNSLNFLRARYYDPEIGRFLSGDPLGGGYAYAGNNPVSFVDPAGLALTVVCDRFSGGTCVDAHYEGTSAEIAQGEAALLTNLGSLRADHPIYSAVVG